jgi:hypothetical protein
MPNDTKRSFDIGTVGARKTRHQRHIYASVAVALWRCGGGHDKRVTRRLSKRGPVASRIPVMILPQEVTEVIVLRVMNPSASGGHDDILEPYSRGTINQLFATLTHATRATG